MRILTTLLLFCIPLFICCNQKLEEPSFLFDEAGVFNKEQQQLIIGKLKSIEERTTNEVVVYTAKSLDSKKIADYNLEIGNKIGIGKIGLNNGMLIFLAPNDRQIQIQVSVGDEWIIPDSVSADIVSAIVAHFKQLNYMEGILNGIALIDKKISAFDWKVYDVGTHNVANIEAGQIISFSYENKERKVFKYPLSTDKQFLPDYFIELTVSDHRKAKIFYTKYMSNVIANFTKIGKIKVFARVRSKDPFELNLLGVVKI